MRIFVVGDYKTGTGPANVTKEYLKRLRKGTLYQRFNSKLLRAAEIFVKSLFCDCILMSGYSAQNLLCIKAAKLFNKKTAYIVHGAITYENKINHEENENMSNIEERTLEGCDLLIAVSEKFAGWLKNNYPQYKEKITYVTNGVDFQIIKESAQLKEKIERDEKLIMSIGGGMPRKAIHNICSAIEILNKEGEDLKLVVIGKDGFDTDKINSYSFVENKGLVSNDEKTRLFYNSSLFIQNSLFETFGLAPVEALSCGVSILTSSVAGVLDILKGAKDEDIINNPEDIIELAVKIKNLLVNPNSERLLSGIDEQNDSWENRTKELENVLDKLMSK